MLTIFGCILLAISGGSLIGWVIIDQAKALADNQ